MLSSPSIRRNHLRAGALLAFLGVALTAITRAAPLRTEPLWHVSGSWRQPEGLPQNSVFCLLETSDGYLWIGTKGGVARFDGVRFTTFDDRDGTQLRENEVWALAEGTDGSLWFGTYGGGVTRLKEGKFTTTAAREGLVNDFVTALCRDGDGGIWIGTEGGLSCFRDGAFTHYPGAALPGSSVIRALYPARSGGVWIVTGRDELLRWKAGAFTVETVPGLSRGLDVQSVCEDSEGAVWLATRSGLLRWKDGKSTRFTPEDGLSSERVRRLHIDRTGVLWIATGDGLDRYVAGRIQSELPLAHSPNALASGREGNLWMGFGSEGFVQLGRGQFRSYTAADGLASAYVAATIEDRHGSIWLATADGLHCFRDGKIVPYRFKEGGLSNRVTCLATDREGYVWVGTEAGIYRFDYDPAKDPVGHGPEFRRIEVPGLARVFARIIYEDRQGDMWIGTNLEGVLRYRDGNFTHFTTRDGLGGNAVRGLCHDRAGNLWIGAKGGGLTCFKDGRFTVYREADGLPSDGVQALYLDRDDDLWIATRHGVSRRHDGRFITYRAKDGLYSNYVYGFCEDDHGYLWMPCAKGVFRVSRRQLDDFAAGKIASFDSAAYGLEHGLVSTAAVVAHHPLAYKASDGKLWFGTSQGVCVVDPASVTRNLVPPPVHVENLSIDQVPYDVQRAIVAPPGRGDLAIRYTGLSFLAPEKVAFKYKLDGYDPAWIDAGARREAYYNRVPPGRYVFRIKAANSDGVWSARDTETAFTVRPFFYQTWWFRALLAGVAVTAGVAGYRVRVLRVQHRARELERQNAELERRVAERTADLEKSHDTLRDSEYFYHSLVESLPQAIARKDPDGRFTYVNAGFSAMVGLPPEQIVGQIDYELCPFQADKHRDHDQRVMATRQPIEYEEVVENEGKKAYMHVKKVPLVDEQEHPIGVQVVFWDMTIFRETEEKLREAQRELLEISRLAGIAEMATGVLHNIGNALNSVNVSVGVVSDRLRRMRIANLDRVAKLLAEQEGRLAEFCATDARAQHLPRYLTELATNLETERQQLNAELDALREGIDHIKDIVAAQQGYAQVSAIIEEMAPAELVEYALRISEASLTRHGVAVVREFAATRPIRVARQKALQILVNILKNAKESVLEANRDDRRLIITIQMGEADRVQFRVQDNGLGIAPENLARIFNFGFTTKRGGHGFGLHSCALAARELGGSLTAFSDGPGLGATFVLELPGEPPAKMSGVNGASVASSREAPGLAERRRS